MIDVIIPCHNSHKFLPRCLSSILMQTIVDELNVIVVRDGGESHQNIIDSFSPYMRIKEVGYDENRGPGYARRFGYLNSNSEYITHIDSDDTFLTSLSLGILFREIQKKEEYVACAGGFIEQSLNNELCMHYKELIWLHGIMYKRSYLDKYKILMPESWANEDVGFNLLVSLCTNDKEKIQFINDEIYLWHFNPDSIVRKNARNYADNLSIKGYVDNTIWAFNEAEKRNITEEVMVKEKLRIMMCIIALYYKSFFRSGEFLESNMKYAKRFYQEMFKSVEDKITSDLFMSTYKIFPDEYKEKYITIPKIYEFLNKMKEE